MYQCSYLRCIRVFGPPPGEEYCSFSTLKNHLKHIIMMQGHPPSASQGSGHRRRWIKFWSDEGAPLDDVLCKPENVTADNIIMCNGRYYFEDLSPGNPEQFAADVKELAELARCSQSFD